MEEVVGNGTVAGCTVVSIASVGEGGAIGRLGCGRIPCPWVKRLEKTMNERIIFTFTAKFKSFGLKFGFSLSTCIFNN